MMKQTFSFLAAALLITMPAFAQRNITSYSEQKITKGQSVTINGQPQSTPDIYYVNKGNNNYEAVRLTVQPASALQSATEPYLMASTSNSVVVAWKTSAKDANSTVTYGTSASNLNQSAAVTNLQITHSYFWYTATIAGLQPNTTYYYNVSSNGVNSGVKSFRTQPTSAAGTITRVLLIGDHQRNEHSDYEWLAKAAKQKADELYGVKPIEEHFNFIMNVGDQVDYGSTEQYEKVLLHKASVVSANLPHMTVAGNHEYKSGSYTTDESKISFYQSHFKNTYGNLTYKEIRTNCAEYYAYQSGRVLFVVLDSDKTTAAQKTWVTQVAEAAAEDTTVDFVVAVQHRPLYAEMYCNDVSNWARNEIMPILARTGKLVLDYAGHHHLYSRGQMTDYNFYHIISGGGVGSDENGYEQLWGVGMAQTDNYNQPEVQKTIDHWTYQIAEFNSATKTMTVSCYSIGNRRLALDNVLVDQFSVNLTASKPAKPALNAVASPFTPPYTFTQASAIGSDINTVQYQISKNSNFSTLEVNSIVNREDMYGVDDNYMPRDLNAGRDISAYVMEANSIDDGKYYIRVRNRNNDLQWSDFSNAVEFTVTGSTGRPYLTLDKTYLKQGQSVTVGYHNAPSGKTWTGYYTEFTNPNNTYKAFEYTTGTGSLTWTPSATGAYFVGMFLNDGYTEECATRQRFVVGKGTNPSISTNKTVYNVGEQIVVTHSDGAQLSKDWVGLYDYYDGLIENGDITYAKSYSYAYVPNSASGSTNLNISSNPNYGVHHEGPAGEGYYLVGYYAADGYTPICDDAHLIIGKPASANPTKLNYSLTDDQSLVINFGNMPYWVSPELKIYNNGSLVDSREFDPLVGSVEVPLAKAMKGNCEAVITWNGTEISPRASFTVVSGKADNPEISLNGEFFRTGSTITVSFENAPVGTGAWLAIYEDGKSGNDGSKEWAYTETADGSKSWTISDKNRYYAVMFRDGGYSECTERVYFVVGDNCDDSHPTTLSLDHTAYAAGDPIVVSCSNSAAAGPEWVGMYGYYDNLIVNGDVTNAKSYSYVYLNGSNDQQITLNVSGNPNFGVHHEGPAGDGYYFVGWFINDGYIPVVPYEYFVIGHPATFELNKSVFDVSEDNMIVYYAPIPAELSPRIVINYNGSEIYSANIDCSERSISLPVNLSWTVDEQFQALDTNPKYLKTYSATIYTGNGEAISDPVEFTMDYTAGVESVTAPEDKISLNGRNLSIVSTVAITRVDIYTIDGRLVATIPADATDSVDVYLDLASGIYVVAVDNRIATKIALR